ncbi:MAG: hypothetical protein RR068_09850 [Hafnia sp.]|jgi:hypothetical protein
MKYWVILFFVLVSFRSDDGEVPLIEEAGHWCSHELHRHAMHELEQLLEF